MLWRGPGVAGGAASGAMGSAVAGHNKGGQYLRARTVPTNPRSGFQEDVRNAIRTLAPSWSSSLTDDQRDAWNVYAANVSRLNRIGDSIHISGIAWYMAINTPRIQAGLTRIDDAPTIFDTGDGGTQPQLFFAAGGTLGTLSLNPGDAWQADANAKMLAYISRPQNAGINFFNGPYRLAGVIPSGTVTSHTIGLPFTAGPAGSLLFGQMRITRGDGRLSAPVKFLGLAP